MINHRPKKQSWWQSLLRSRFMIAINLLLIGFVGWSLFRESANGTRVGDKYNDLERQIKTLEKQNQDYTDIISKLGTSGFVEREARVKLGYQKPGEQVLMLKDAVGQSSDSIEDDTDSLLTNPERWWRYFFGS